MVKKKIPVKKKGTKNKIKISEIIIGILVILNIFFLITILINHTEIIKNDSDNINENSEIKIIEEFLNEATQGQFESYKKQKIGVKVNINVENEPTWGKQNSKVVVVEYSDFECPYCKTFYEKVYKKLKSDYSDKIKFVYKDFPLNFHSEAQPTAISANCVLELNGNEDYFKFHDLVFENQDKLNQDSYLTWAKQVGVNEIDFKTCILKKEISDEIQEDIDGGIKAGIRGTPTIFINEKKIQGYNYEDYKNLIDEELNK